MRIPGYWRGSSLNSRYIRLHPATTPLPFQVHTGATSNGGLMDLTRRVTLAGILGLVSAGAFAHGRRMHGAMDPAQMDERIEHFIKHLAVDVNATPEQQKKLEQIA